MAKGWMSKDPSEMTARQQRRMQFLEKRGRGGRVQGQPTEMPEMTARQQRRQQFLQRKQARQDRRVEDWRAQQQGANMGENLGDFARQPFDTSLVGTPRDLSQVQDGLGRFGPGVPYPLDLGGMGNKFGQYRPGTTPEMFQQPIFNTGPMNTLYNPIGESSGIFAGGIPFNPQEPMPQQPTYMDPRFAEANQRQMRGWGARYMNSQFPGAQGRGVAMPPRPGQG